MRTSTRTAATSTTTTVNDDVNDDVKDDDDVNDDDVNDEEERMQWQVRLKKAAQLERNSTHVAKGEAYILGGEVFFFFLIVFAYVSTKSA